MSTSKEQDGAELAWLHYEIEPGMVQIFRLYASDEVEERVEEPIKLLEVNEHTIPAGIMPIRFGPMPSRGIDFSTIIVEVTPEEFQEIQAGKLELPHGWVLGEAIARHAVAGTG